MGILKKVLFVYIVLASTLAFSSELTGEEVSSLSFFSVNQEAQKDIRFYYLWASWCPDCKSKLRGDIPNLEEKFPQASVQTVNMDRNKKRATSFIEDESLKLNVFRDEKKIFAKKLQLFSVPSWVVVKKQGENWKVVAKNSGSEIDEIQKAIISAQKEEK